jgi:hypothetical protein
MTVSANHPLNPDAPTTGAFSISRRDLAPNQKAALYDQDLRTPSRPQSICNMRLFQFNSVTAARPDNVPGNRNPYLKHVRPPAANPYRG